MNKLALALSTLFFITACSNDNNNVDMNQIYGTWEITSLVGNNGQSSKVVKPDENSTDEESNYMQLVITKKDLTYISNDYGSVDHVTLPIEIEGRRIVTQDTITENSSFIFTDFEVIKTSPTELQLRFVDEDGSVSEVYGVFSKIETSLLGIALQF